MDKRIVGTQYDGKPAYEVDWPDEVMIDQSKFTVPDNQATGCFCIGCLVGVETEYFASSGGRCPKCAYLRKKGVTE